MRLLITMLMMLAMMLSAPLLAAADTPPDQQEPSGYMDPNDSSPLSALNPAEGDLKIWIGPIIMGVFALILILFIRRFSKTRRQDQAQSDPEDRRDP